MQLFRKKLRLKKIFVTNVIWCIGGLSVLTAIIYIILHTYKIIAEFIENDFVNQKLKFHTNRANRIE